MTNNKKNNVIIVPSKNKQPNGLAIASIYLGFFAVILSFFFSVGLILALPGLIFGIVAIIKKQGIIGILGTIFSSIALIISIIVLFFMAQSTTSTITDTIINQIPLNEAEATYENNIELSKQQELDYINEMNRLIDEMVVAIDNFNFATNYSINWTDKADEVLTTIQSIVEDIDYLETPDWFYETHKNISSHAANLYSGAKLVKKGLRDSNVSALSKGRDTISDRRTEILLDKIDLIPIKNIEDKINIWK